MSSSLAFMLRQQRLLVAALIVGFAVSAPNNAFAQPGTVLGEQKISQTTGGFTGPLNNFDFFGSSITSLGDLDGAGPSATAVAVGAPLDDDGAASAGAVWVLFLDAGGSVLSESKISATAGGFTGLLDANDNFGSSLAGLGDINGDGTVELAVGSPRDDDSLPPNTAGGDRGAVYILSLTPTGAVASHVKISASVGDFGGVLDSLDRFGSAVGAAGDIDGDGRVDLVVGAELDDDGGTGRGAAWVLFLDTDGIVLSEQKISGLDGGFTGVLDDNDGFGSAVVGIGDLDGNGTPDLAVAARNDDDGSDALANFGAVWILFLNGDGTVATHQKISNTDGAFTGILDRGDTLGYSLVAIGDIDGDAVTELAVGTANDDDGGTDTGAVWILFMNTDGTVALNRKISALDGGFLGPLGTSDNFGSGVAALGDIDGDGVNDLGVGARFNDDGGSTRGAAWILLLDGAVSTCGNGIVEGAEDCDDGNTEDADCCSSVCRFEGAGTRCLDNDLCNGTEVCDGAGTCLAGPVLNCNDSNLCTDDGCDALSGCINAANTAPCSDSNLCTTGDQCVNGVCAGQAPLNCDDGSLCTFDTCDDALGCLNEPALRNLCRVSEKGKLKIEIETLDPDETELEWKWQKGALVELQDLGDPTADTDYTLCIFDQDNGTVTLATELTVPANGAWRDKGSKGWDYKDHGTFDGVRKLKVRTGADGKARVDLKAEGLNLPMPSEVAPGQFFVEDPSVIVQMINSVGTCWESEVNPKVEFDD